MLNNPLLDRESNSYDTTRKLFPTRKNVTFTTQKKHVKICMYFVFTREVVVPVTELRTESPTPDDGPL